MATKTKSQPRAGARTAAPAPKVAILMGSASDGGCMKGARDVLVALGIPYEVHVTSAHRTPERTHRIVRDAERRGVAVFIAGAGWAAHLAGVVASLTLRPVLGVPVDSSPLQGLDSLLSTVQMPPGVPVGTVATGEGGARNAAYLAARILALGDAGLARRLEAEQKRMADGVVASHETLRKQWVG